MDKKPKESYKDTLLMPKTNFEMRANLGQKELIIQDFWTKKAIYQTLLTKNKKGKSFILHDGPPYANGDLHMGHALNKILKDIIIRYYNSNGFYAPYIPGWDTHGLPIEQAVTNSGIDRKAITINQFRNQCQTYATKQIANQKTQFQRLGLLADFKDCYYTFDKNYEAAQIRSFAKMIDKKLVYRNLYPVYWSPSSESALAEAEIEYLNKKSWAIFVAFDLVNDHNSALVIWTTTPWTIPANQLLAVNENFTYVLIKVGKKKYYLAIDLLTSFVKANKITDYKIIKQIPGSQLVGLKTLHPLYNRQTPVVHSDHVNLESGTGIVHIASGFGVDDFSLALKNKVKILVPIDDQGRFTSEVKDETLVGKFYDDTNQIIINRLKENEHLLSSNLINHSYPHDWRTKKPVIYRATWQWFIAIKDLKPQVLKALNKVEFQPEWGKKRLTLMIKNRNDWCISRQRIWGVPIPIFYTEKDTPILDSKVINHVADIFAKDGSNVWYQKSAQELLPENYHHKDSPNNIFTKETDIMDVWYDSGVSHLAVMLEHDLPWPVDLYLEGNDQFRGWFNSSLITGVVAKGQSPYKTALAHGFVNDEKGNKMSKSLGNTVTLSSVCQVYGADILRLWAASVDFQDDTTIGLEILKQISENYRKIRNLLRFLLGNLFDFNFKPYLNKAFSQVLTQLTEVDQYILVKLNNLIKISHQSYQNYDFINLYKETLNFITNDLSAFYCDISKDVLYLNRANDLRRRQIQTTMFYIVKDLMILLSPILPHTCEEAFQSLNQTDLSAIKSSLMHQKFPQVQKINDETKILAKWDAFLTLKNDVNQALSQAQTKGIIKNTLESDVIIKLKKANPLLTTFDQESLTKLLIVSSAQVINYNINPTYSSDLVDITVSLKQGSKCPRCWLIYSSLTTDVCQRCTQVLTKKN